ncbi:hypothetical protein HanIR_Chr13g0641911 [Helianthus annuus]|nr:hypothetical protein HanIR_Chr13g0641911 [Helianthus annuus]
MVIEEQGEYNQPLLHCVFYCFGWNKGTRMKIYLGFCFLLQNLTSSSNLIQVICWF